MAAQGLGIGRRPRVLFLSSCVSGGGVGRSLVTYLKHEAPLIEATVVMPEPGVIGQTISSLAGVSYVPQFVERIQRGPYRWIKRLGWPWLEFCGGVVALVSSFFSIRKLCQKIEPDFIYCNHMLAEPIGLAVARATNTPLVIHVRNVHVEPVAKLLFPWIGQRKITKLIICNSQSSAEPYLKKSRSKVRIVPNSVDLAQFDRTHIEPKLRQSAGLAEDALVIGYLGRLVPKKGIDILLRAFALVHEKFPQARLALVGGNDHGIYRDMKGIYVNLAHELGLEGKLIFTGFQPDVRPYLASAAVMVAPLDIARGTQNKILEGMAAGVPVVSSRLAAGGVDAVSPDHLLVASTPEEYVATLLRILDDRGERDRLARAGRERVLSHHSWAQSMRRLDAIVERCLSSLQPSRSLAAIS